MDPSVVASSFALLFLAEMGDKTQLMTMSLASRYRAAPVAIGACAAFLVLNLLAVLVGQLLFSYVPMQAVLIVAALLFLAFAWQSWRSADVSGEAEAGATSTRGALVGSFALIFVAELGDKTQLALLALAASTGAPWSVFTGGTLALWCVALLGVFLGAKVLARLPRRRVHQGAALLFALFGVVALARAVLSSG